MHTQTQINIFSRRGHLKFVLCLGTSTSNKDGTPKQYDSRHCTTRRCTGCPVRLCWSDQIVRVGLRKCVRFSTHCERPLAYIDTNSKIHISPASPGHSKHSLRNYTHKNPLNLIRISRTNLVRQRPKPPTSHSHRIHQSQKDAKCNELQRASKLILSII